MAFKKPVCNCPDASAQRTSNVSAEALSNQIASNWSTGFKGIRAAGGYCEHELAVLRIRKELDTVFPGGIPKDLPTASTPDYQKTKSISRLQNPARLGDDFSL
ncbi:hypothetical protein G7B40_001475 [Aetokthonos hydrillicola Thurmond2011]|uniref:Uncharacterized protein n=1 Tax=Aetokthonos hydrillicola Thurmond2011 TaxID=2712845 RepID=A0AAP5M2Z8_9CYAN|nr:hypothetical protein [Aetokthonos hydrillicola]MBO3463135.1 hypothetical protein [Aetokthonos hydrillicola CCALA 1050]MBW4591081.1 hypothetical protein [Aetokthonos hydrillicola CCALA 1050]MDR9893256.1 hypothetical protein [Aetokthonos hydrillicola Thurmond2011]